MVGWNSAAIGRPSIHWAGLQNVPVGRFGSVPFGLSVRLFAVGLMLVAESGLPVGSVRRCPSGSANLSLGAHNPGLRYHARIIESVYPG